LTLLRIRPSSTQHWPVTREILIALYRLAEFNDNFHMVSARSANPLVRRGLAEREDKGYRITDLGKAEAVKVMARHPELTERQYDVVNRSSSYQAGGGQP